MMETLAGTFTLNSPLTEEDWDKITDVDFDNTRAVTFHTKHGKEVEFVKAVRNTAEWIYGEKDGADGWYCSKCGFHIPWYYDYYGLNNIDFIRDFHTCPHCDAKMMKYTGMKGEWDD